MTEEGRGGILVVAVVVSIALHFGAMFYARPKVMTHIGAKSARVAHREPMRVAKNVLPPEPVRIETVRDVDAPKEAPEAEAVAELPPSPAPGEAKAQAAALPAPVTAPPPAALVPKMDPPPLDVKLLGSERSESRVEMPAEPLAAPAGLPSVAPAETVLPMPMSAGKEIGPEIPPALPVAERMPTGWTKIGKVPDGGAEVERFEPAAEVLEKVDEKVVEREKAAVRELLDVSEAEELSKFVNVAMTKTVDGQWTYFKLMVLPRHELPVVPKDVVVLIDASGSIGKDRIRSVRTAAKRILRSCTNSGDRFNLVAFRDRYSYAFRRWRECSQSSFDSADAWLDDLAAHGRTDVFSSIASVLTLPRDPSRPLVALVVTDGDANSGVRGTAEILSKFTALNDGLVSVYMYGVRNSANRELIDVLTHGNRGESLIYDGWWKWDAASGLESLSERFRDPVLSDLRIVFSADVRAEAYPRLLRNLYRGDAMAIYGRVPAGVEKVSFSLKGLNGKVPYEGFFTIHLADVATDPTVVGAWQGERGIDLKLK